MDPRSDPSALVGMTNFAACGMQDASTNLPHYRLTGMYTSVSISASATACGSFEYTS